MAAEIDRVIQQRSSAALATKSTADLRTFLDYFDGQPAAAAARRELLRRLIADKRDLEAEMLLWPDRQSPDRAVAGPAVAQLADLLEAAGHHDGAAVCYQQLRRQFAAVACRDGKTGKELVEALPRDGPLGELLKPAAAWPRGQVETTTKIGVSRNDNFGGWGRFVVQYQGDPGPFFSDQTLRFDQNRTSLLVYDRFGRMHWQVPLTENGQRANVMFNGNMADAYVQGHVLVLPLGNRIFAFDPAGLTGAGNKQPSAGKWPPADNRQPGSDRRLLWSQDLNDSSGDSGKKAAVRAVGLLGAPGFVFNQFQLRANPVGAISSRCLCFQRFRNLVAVDTLTGETLWVRHNVPPASQIFGDDQYIFVLPAQQPNPSGQPVANPVAHEALVFRARTASRWASATCRRLAIPTWRRSTPFEGWCSAMPPRRATSVWPRWAATSSPGTPAARPPPRWADSSLGKKGPRSTCSIHGNSGPSGRRASSAPDRRWRWRERRPSA